MAETFERYGARWPVGLDDLQVEMGCIRQGGSWKSKAGVKCGLGLSQHYENMRSLIDPTLDNHRWSSLCRDEVLKNKVTVLMGPGSCLLGSTKILDPVTGEEPTIQELCESGTAPTVMTLHGPKMAGIPYVKGYEELYEVVLDDGSRFTSTPNHRVLSVDGFCRVDSLQIGQRLFSYAPILPDSTSGTVPLIREQDAQSSRKTVEGFQSRCSAGFYLDDEQLLEARAVALEPTPSHADAPERSRDDFWMGCPACGSECSRSYQEFFRPSTCNASLGEPLPGILGLYHAHEEICGHASCLSRPLLRFQKKKRHLSPSASLAPYFSSTQNACGNQILRISHPSFSGPFSQPLRRCGIPYKYDSSFDRFGKTLEATRFVLCDDSNSDLSTCLKVSTARVLSITKAGKHVHYDIQVPDVHHYFAQGTIHHNSGKTHTPAWIYLFEYFCFPEETCVLVSSTDMRGLKLRVWGEIANLWSKAVAKYEYLPGHMLDSALAITTDSLEDCDANNRNVRDMRKGIIGIPTMTGGKFVGLGKWVGIKQKRVRLIADEAALMGAGFLSAFSNLNKNEDFRACVLGNPNDIYDCLGRCAEPLDGWDAHMNPEKTCTWKTRFMNGICVNLIGTDSPNFDYPEDQPTRYKYLISRQKIAETVSFFGKDSYEYYSQCVGSMRIGQLSRRVLSRRMCEENGALESDVNWMNGSRTRVYFVDAAYGGDRAVGGWGEFGKVVGGKVRLLLHPPSIIPIKIGESEPEAQISDFVKHECTSLGIPPENMGHDSTGRGSLGTYLARAWSANTNPIESGGTPSDRPVSLDIYITDPKTNVRRLKTCKEHYVKKVSEFWFSVRYTVQAGQLAGLTDEVMEEFCMREWDRVSQDRIEIETKGDMKERTGRSPDLADWAAGIVEMARRRGFQISKLANETQRTQGPSYLRQHEKTVRDIIRSKDLILR